MMASPSPKSPEQTEKHRQYDRQLRLWGDHGQLALENGHVCLINATALGTEALKSLVLPGIGSFTIVDDTNVKEEDVGSNFFLESSSIGQSRATEAVRLLLELNPAVQGYAVPDSPDQLLKEHPDFFHTFTVVIATAISEKTLIQLSQNLWDANIPLILCRSVGFLGSLRIQVKEHTIIEAHPDNQPSDLRLDTPFPSLDKYMEAFDLETMEFKEHAHIPWLVVLYKSLETWRKAHEGRWPLSRREKEQIKDIIRSGIRKDENGIPLGEENFEEALRAVNSSVIQTLLPTDVKDILYDNACINLTQKSSPFWILCSALRGFVESEGGGTLPLRGTLPDMTASTHHYVALQNIYRAKAAADAEAVYRRVQQLVVDLGAESIGEADVKLICKTASSLCLIRGSSISEEYQSGSKVAAYIGKHLEEPDPMMLHYVLLRGAEKFHAEQCRAPGDWEPETDISELKTGVTKLLGEWSCSPLSKDDHVHEMCRYGGSELHSVSAFMGGCVAQEVIKLVTRQYIPVNNLFIHEATSSNSATFTL